MNGILDGKVIVVTGAARGIGRASALELARRGATVAGIDLGEVGPDPETGAVHGFRCDISDEAAVIETMAAVAAKFGRLDAVANIAGIMQEKPTADTSAAEFMRVLSVNLLGTFLVGREALKYFRPATRDEDKPRIINTASELAHLGREEYAAYTASKGGVVTLTRTWALEFAPDILVNAVAPGPTDTDMLKTENNYPHWKDDAEGIPLRRVGEPEDIARVVAFLCGPDASYMTGSVVDVNGGAAMY